MEAKICFPFKWINKEEVGDVGMQGLMVIFSYHNDDLISSVILQCPLLGLIDGGEDSVLGS